jgi:hypothetical protein
MWITPESACQPAPGPPGSKGGGRQPSRPGLPPRPFAGVLSLITETMRARKPQSPSRASFRQTGQVVPVKDGGGIQKSLQLGERRNQLLEELQGFFPVERRRVGGSIAADRRQFSTSSAIGQADLELRDPVRLSPWL